MTDIASELQVPEILVSESQFEQSKRSNIPIFLT